MTPKIEILIEVCTHAHPTTGDVCTLNSNHVQHSDPKTQQHNAENGVKWPLLSVLAPAEGYNDFVLFSM